MIIKKFTAKTEDEALKAAKAELGMQAVIMNVKKVKKKGLSGLFSKPSVEVTAAIEEEKADMGGTPVPLRSRREMEEDKASKIQTQPMKSSQDKKLSKYKDVLTDEEYDKLHPEEKKEEEKKSSPEKIDNLHVLIEQQLKSVMEQEAKKESAESKKEGSKEIMSFIKLIYTTLINNEVDEKYANDLIEEIEKLSKPGVTIDFLLSNIYQKLILKFGVSRGIVASDGKPKVIVFIGPTGVGKTTTIAKLASEMAVNQKKKVALVTTDTYRIKAAEQLRSYAEIMDVVVDVPFKVIYSADDIKNTLEELKEQDFIFVDTAGYSPKDKEKRDEMKHILDAAKEVADTETFLVLSVTTKYRDLLSICDIYKEMDDFKIIFTKLDETSTFGNMYNIRIYTGAEISYITDGQDVPDDIEAFNPQSIVRSILGGS